jgi:hypothetical protein
VIEHVYKCALLGFSYKYKNLNYVAPLLRKLQMSKYEGMSLNNRYLIITVLQEYL